MKIKRYIQLSIVSALLSTPLPLLAGNLNSPAAPGNASSAMCTLNDIWDRLKGTTTDIPTSSSFNEPTSGPGSTMHTLTDICNELDTVMDAIPSNPALVHATGETGSTGVAWPNPRFTVNTTVDNNSDGDCDDEGETCAGTVTDNLTGLIWLANANCTDLTGVDGTTGKANWDTAKTAASGLTGGTCGLASEFNAGDWRLPSVNELQSLVHYGFFSPPVPNTAGTGQWTTDGQPFSGVQTDYYWSSTTLASSSSNAWRVHLGYGYVNGYDKAITFYVWPVRGGV